MITRLSSLIRKFTRDERGVFGVIFGLLAIVLVALGGAVVDYVTLEQVRNRSQIALDAAALALQPDSQVANVNKDNIQKAAQALVDDRVGKGLVTIRNTYIDRTQGSLRFTGDLTTPTMFVALVGVRTMSAAIQSEVQRGALDMEVSVALDVTGSMSGQRIQDLKDSVTELVNAVVQDVQTPTYTKMALIPYSQAVNAGTYAQALRGPIRQPKTVTAIAPWTSGVTRSINTITQASTATVTSSSNHALVDGDWIVIWDNYGMSELNTGIYQISRNSNTQFQLRGVDSRNFSRYRNSGKFVKCLFAGCAVPVTALNTGYANGEWVHLTDVTGMTNLNDTSFQVSNASVLGMTLTPLNLTNGLNGTNGISLLSGKLHCTWQNASEGCTYYRFQSPEGNFNTFAVTNCVTERSPNGTNDLPPTTTFAGRNYPPDGNNCLTSSIVPLTSNKTTLNNAISGLGAVGSTSGSLGILWSWYMLSPNFGYVWPTASRPAAYGGRDLLKAAIIMTDGEFNTVHCNGAVANNSTSGSGANSDHIWCDAPNGDPYDQARAYCNAMKAAGISIYTVAFDIAANTPADQIMKYCASSSANAFTAANGAQLRDTFRQIGRLLSSLRITQ